MLELVFLTTSDKKMAHARFLCRHYNVIVSKQKHYGISYEEPRSDSRDFILSKSIENAKERWQKTVSSPDEKFFFIEDTSVVIEALSSEKEVPGVDVKFWMKNMTFEKLDELLKKHGNNRRVKVRSDIILKLTRHLKIFTGKDNLHFYSSVDGFISEHNYNIQTQPLYPWLDDQTFNKWFIPNGYEKPISLLPIEQAEQSDFRNGAFSEMLAFLEKHKIIKKIPNVEKAKKKSLKVARQSNLFTDPLLFIVSGPTCAGKTTLAEFLTDHYLYYHIEASDFMYLSFYKRHSLNSNVPIGDYAEAVLKEDSGIVVRQTINEIEETLTTPFIITGFRSDREINLFKNLYEGKFKIEVIYIETKQEIRFMRCKERNRNDFQIDNNDFAEKDMQQVSMGLNEIKEKLTDQILTNNKSFEEYYWQFRSKYHDAIDDYQEKLPDDLKSSKKPFKLEDEIILALYLQPNKNIYLTTTEIAHLVNQTFSFYNNQSKKSKNNVSRYFNQYYYAYYEYKEVDNKIKVRLSQTGVGRAKWLFRNHMHN